MAGFNYYASPYNDPRAIAFREAYAKAKMGEDFWFEGQPYAGPPAPPGLLAEEGPGTATGYVEMPQIPESDQAQMPPGMQARIDAEEANRKRLGGGPDVKFMRDQPVWDHFEKRWVDPEGPIVQSPHILDTLEQEGINASHASGPYNPPRFAAALQKGPRQIQHAPPSSVTGRYGESGGQGLLGDSPGLEGTDTSGWMGDRRFREANNKWRLASMLLNYGKGGDEGWWTVGG